MSLFELTGCDVTDLDCETTGRNSPSCSVTERDQLTAGRALIGPQVMMSQCGCKLTLPLVRDAVVWSGSGQDAFTEVTLKEDRSCSDQVPGPPEGGRSPGDLWDPHLRGPVLTQTWFWTVWTRAGR